MSRIRVRPRVTRPLRKDTAGQGGAALLEFVLVAPLFLSLIYGLRGIVTLSRARQELAIISHAVMREAESGVTNEAVLTGLANGYAKSMGMHLSDRLVVTLESAGLPSPVASGVPGPIGGLLASAAPGVRVKVTSLIPVGAILPGRWSHGFPMKCSTVCLIGCWKSPVAMLKNVLPVPSAGTSGSGQ